MTIWSGALRSSGRICDDEYRSTDQPYAPVLRVIGTRLNGQPKTKRVQLLVQMLLIRTTKNQSFKKNQKSSGCLRRARVRRRMAARRKKSIGQGQAGICGNHM